MSIYFPRKRNENQASNIISAVANQAISPLVLFVHRNEEQKRRKIVKKEEEEKKATFA